MCCGRKPKKNNIKSSSRLIVGPNNKLNETKDPVHFFEGKWHFWNETRSNRMGPYNTKDEATQALLNYVKEQL